MNRMIIIAVCFMGMLPSMTSGQPRDVFTDSDIRTDLAGFNTESSDISPVMAGSSVYFSSIRGEYFRSRSRMRKNMAFYDLYEVNALHGEIPRLVRGFGNDYHEGPASWCASTGELFVTLSNIAEPDQLNTFFPKEHVRLRLAIAALSGGEWKIISELPFNSSSYHTAHPAISLTGDTLVFSSDMPGGMGKSDLWMSIRRNGTWSQPVNLGKRFNTPGNEMYPAFGPGGLLMFASDGHGGSLGGLDIYYTAFPQQGELKNAGSAINSAYDDFGLVLSPDASTGYFASNRPGVGSDDIYRVTFTRRAILLKGRVVDEDTGQSVSGAVVVILDCDDKEISTLQAGSDGIFSVEIPAGGCSMARATAAGYEAGEKRLEGSQPVEVRLRQVQQHRFRVTDLESGQPLSGAVISCGESRWTAGADGMIQIPVSATTGCALRASRGEYLDQSLDTPFSAGNNSPVEVRLMKKELNRTFTLENIYYDLNRWEILPASAAELDKLVTIMRDNPALRVELGSHTDSRGSDAYNLTLSQRRSDSAVAYIVGKGIRADRITARGYGETQPVNRCANGVSCSEEEHRRNRRTEFKIVGF